MICLLHHQIASIHTSCERLLFFTHISEYLVKFSTRIAHIFGFPYFYLLLYLEQVPSGYERQLCSV